MQATASGSLDSEQTCGTVARVFHNEGSATVAPGRGCVKTLILRFGKESFPVRYGKRAIQKEIIRVLRLNQIIVLQL